MPTLPEIVGEIVADAVTFIGEAVNMIIPGPALAGGVVQRWLRHREEAARDILFDELRQAKISEAQAASEDDAVGIVFRYMRAARDGAARVNLRLLAKVIVGQQRTGTLVADEFLQYADTLTDLSRDEIIVIGTVYQHTVGLTVQQGEDSTQYAGRVWASSMQELSSVGFNEPRMLAAASRAQRSGLIYIGGGGVDGAETYRASPTLVELGKTVDFQDALRKEKII